MYLGGVTFSINKSFGRLQLIPEANGLRLYYVPIQSNQDKQLASERSVLDVLIPLDCVGGLWSTVRAFTQGVESLDEAAVIISSNDKDAFSEVQLHNLNPSEDHEMLVKLYRDKPRGAQGKLNGEETCWLRIVTGRTEEERRRIKLGPRDLLSIDLALQSVLTIAAVNNSHKPRLVANDKPHSVILNAKLLEDERIAV